LHRLLPQGTIAPASAEASMLVLILGLAIFLGTHLFTTWRRARAAVLARIGEGPFKLAYSVLSLVGLVLIVVGYGQAREAGPVEVWNPPSALRHLALLLNLPIFVLIAAAYLPGRIKEVTKHPMLLAVKLWALAHLIANGDLASILLFGSFLAWAVLARIAVKKREAVEGRPDRSGPARNDAVAVAIGLVLFAVTITWLHPLLIGVPVV
jgi:uncharacterized membrane protein